jgi:UDP:flavonoid glycosyltransferase YjiC (YdhE family)
MARIVWVCWDGGGNLTPSLGVAQALVARGHDLVFIGRQEMLARVRAAGLPVREIGQAYALIDRYEPGVVVRIFGYLSSPAVGEELVSLVRAEAPDLVVIDCMFGAALDVAAQFGAPTAVMVHTFVRRMYAAWQGNLRMQSDLRLRAGFPPLPPLEELWGARDLVHANTLEEFDGDAVTPLANLRHGAPVLVEETRAVPPQLPWAEDDPRPLVLLSFSTVTDQRSPEHLQRALDALAPLPVRVVATLGAIVAATELAAPANAVLLGFASHEALMRRASLVVTHGGHGTAMRSLRAGVPMVCIPALGGDQPFVAAAVQEWGAGRALPREADHLQIRAAAEMVLADPGCRAQAGRLGGKLAGIDGAERAADSVEKLLAAAPPGGRTQGARR